MIQILIWDIGAFLFFLDSFCVCFLSRKSSSYLFKMLMSDAHKILLRFRKILYYITRYVHCLIPSIVYFHFLSFLISYAHGLLHFLVSSNDIFGHHPSVVCIIFHSFHLYSFLFLYPSFFHFLASSIKCLVHSFSFFLFLLIQ